MNDKKLAEDFNELNKNTISMKKRIAGLQSSKSKTELVEGWNALENSIEKISESVLLIPNRSSVIKQAFFISLAIVGGLLFGVFILSEIFGISTTIAFESDDYIVPESNLFPNRPVLGDTQLHLKITSHASTCRLLDM